MTTNDRYREYVYAPNDALYEYHNSLTDEMTELQRAKDDLYQRLKLAPEQFDRVQRDMRDDYVHSAQSFSKNEVHPLDTKNLRAALEWIDRRSRQRGAPVSRNDIRAIHNALMGGIWQNTAEVGDWRESPRDVAGSSLTPTIVPDIGPQMDILVDWLHLSTTDPVDVPIVVASVAHVWLTAIHPFAEGNGRTARLVMALILLGQEFPLVSLHERDRDAYSNSLEASNGRDISDFLKLLLNATSDSLDRFEDLAKKAKQVARSVSVDAQRADLSVNSKTQNEYQFWLMGMESVIRQFEAASEAFNSETNDIEADMWVYDELTYEQFNGLLKRRQPKKTGIFSILFKGPRLRVGYQFFAEFSSAEMADRADISLIISRDEAIQGGHKWDYVRLDHIGGTRRPDIRELAYSTNHREWLVRRRHTITTETLNVIVRDFFREVMECEDFSR